MIILLIALAWLLGSAALWCWLVSLPQQRERRRLEAHRRWVAQVHRPRTFRAQDDHLVERPDVPRKGLR